MRHFFIVTLFSLLSCQAFASDAYNKSEEFMRAYINNPTCENLNNVQESLSLLQDFELISLDISGTDFKRTLYSQIKDLPKLPSRVSYFNYNEPIYRNFILILFKLMPALKREEKSLLQDVCEAYSTQSLEVPNEVKTAFDMLGKRYSFNVREFSIKQAVFLSLQQGRYIDCMGYGVHVLDTLSRQHTGKVAATAALLLGLGVYSALF